MSELVITLDRLFCEEVTDDFLEGLTDEFGWRIEATSEDGRTLELGDLPMAETASVAPGKTYEIDKEIARLAPEWSSVRLEFWDQDTFNEDDLLGAVEIQRQGSGPPTVTAAEATRALDDGSYHLTGANGDYTIWLTATEV